MKKVLSLLLVLVVVLTACGGSDTASAGGTFVRAGSEPESIDPTLISYSQSFDIAANNFSGIYEVDGDGVITLAGADSVDISDDGLTYTVNLKEGLQWVNSEGEEMGEVTANDYTFAYERILTAENQAPMAYLLQGVIVGADDMLNGNITFDEVGIKAIDDYTLEFNLNYVAPYFAGMLAFPTYYPQPAGAFEEYGDSYGTSADTIWYNGPFYTTSFDAEYEVTQVKNESYWDADSITLDGVTFRTIEDTNSAKEAFTSGEIDFFTSSDENLYNEGIEVDGETVNATDKLTGYTFFMTLNTDEARVTGDADLREALYYGFDREDVLEGYSGNIDTPIEYYMPEGITGVTYDGVEYRDYAEDSYGSYDQERAQEALQTYMDKEGITDPADVEVEFLTNDSDGGERVATSTQAALQEDLGITVNVSILPSAQYVTARNEGNFDIASGGWGADYADPSTYFDIFKSSNIGSINSPRYDNPDYDAAAEAAAQITDVDARMEAYAELEEMVLSDYAIIPFYQKNEPYFISDDFEISTTLFMVISDKYTTYSGTSEE